MDKSGPNETLMLRQRDNNLLLVILGLLMAGCSGFLWMGEKPFHPFSDHDVELTISINDTLFSVAEVADYSNTRGYYPYGYADDNHPGGLGFRTGPPLNGPKLILTMHNRGREDVRAPLPDYDYSRWGYPQFRVTLFRDGQELYDRTITVDAAESSCCDRFRFVTVAAGDSLVYPSCIDILGQCRYHEASPGRYEVLVELYSPCPARGDPPALTGRITSNRVMFRIVDCLPDRFASDAAGNAED